MSSNLISEKLQNDGKINGYSAFSDKSLAPINGRYRSKSLSSDKLNKTNADRAAILDDAEDHHLSEKSETPGCLVKHQIMEQDTHTTANGSDLLLLLFTKLTSLVGKHILIVKIWSEDGIPSDGNVKMSCAYNMVVMFDPSHLTKGQKMCGSCKFNYDRST